MRKFTEWEHAQADWYAKWHDFFGMPYTKEEDMDTVDEEVKE